MIQTDCKELNWITGKAKLIGTNILTDKVLFGSDEIHSTEWYFEGILPGKMVRAVGKYLGAQYKVIVAADGSKWTFSHTIRNGNDRIDISHDVVIR